jgi:Ca2+-binding RTX toxin-like protein
MISNQEQIKKIIDAGNGLNGALLYSELSWQQTIDAITALSSKLSLRTASTEEIATLLKKVKEAAGLSSRAIDEIKRDNGGTIDNGPAEAQRQIAYYRGRITVLQTVDTLLDGRKLDIGDIASSFESLSVFLTYMTKGSSLSSLNTILNTLPTNHPLYSERKEVLTLLNNYDSVAKLDDLIVKLKAKGNTDLSSLKMIDNIEKISSGSKLLGRVNLDLIGLHFSWLKLGDAFIKGNATVDQFGNVTTVGGDNSFGYFADTLKKASSIIDFTQELYYSNIPKSSLAEKIWIGRLSVLATSASTILAAMSKAVRPEDIKPADYIGAIANVVASMVGATGVALVAAAADGISRLVADPANPTTTGWDSLSDGAKATSVLSIAFSALGTLAVSTGHPELAAIAAGLATVSSTLTNVANSKSAEELNLNLVRFGQSVPLVSGLFSGDFSDAAARAKVELALSNFRPFLDSIGAKDASIFTSYKYQSGSIINSNYTYVPIIHKYQVANVGDGAGNGGRVLGIFAPLQQALDANTAVWNSYAPLSGTVRVITGTAKDDVFINYDNSILNAEFRGGDGNDHFFLDLGDSRKIPLADGGAGFDTVYAVAAKKVVANLLQGTASLSVVSTSDQSVSIALRSIEALVAGSGNDELTGNNSNNKLVGGAGEDTLYGGLGDDILAGDGGSDAIYGGEGDDTISGGDGDIRTDSLYGGAGDDVIYAGADSVFGEDGHDRIILAASAIETNFPKTVYGGTGIDTAVFEPGAYSSVQLENNGTKIVFVKATNEKKYLTLDSIEHIEFSSRVNFDGANYSSGVFLTGSSGGDSIVGGLVNDTLVGALGDDVISGGSGSNFIYGGDGNDNLTSSGLSDQLFGGAGDDTLIVLSSAIGNASLYGGAGNDRLIASSNNEYLYGGSGDETISGEAGLDELFGDEGNDVLYGGLGTDALYGGIGNDVIYGGYGENNAIYYEKGDGDDVLYSSRHITSGDGDQLILRGITSGEATFRFDGNDLLVVIQSGGTIRVKDWRTNEVPDHRFNHIKFEQTNQILSHVEVDRLARENSKSSILVNGSFDRNDGLWYFPYNTGGIEWSSSAAIYGMDRADGGFVELDNGSGGTLDSITQYVTTEVGGEYKLSFDLGYRPSFQSSVEVYVDGKLLNLFTATTGGKWTNCSARFIATSKTTSVEFRELSSENDSCGSLLDSITINNVLNGAAIWGTGGNDNLVSSLYVDAIDGKGGVDTVDYSLSTSGVTVNLGSLGPQSGGFANGDTLVGIESIIGSKHQDGLTGVGGGVVDGNEGDDYLVAGSIANKLNLIANGNFDNNTGMWYYQYNAGGIEWSSSAATYGMTRANGGFIELDNGAVSTLDSIKQNVATEIGRPYQLSFDLGYRPSFNSSVEVYIDGVFARLYSATTPRDWTNCTLLFQAKSTYSLIEFRELSSENNGCGSLLDSIKVTIAGDKLIGGIGNDTLIGGADSDQLYGGVGQDQISGGDGDDDIYGGSGNDVIDGGVGTDAAVYSGRREDYFVSYSSSTGAYTIQDIRSGSPDGTDTLRNVEKHQFSDQTEYGTLTLGRGSADITAARRGSSSLKVTSSGMAHGGTAAAIVDGQFGFYNWAHTLNRATEWIQLDLGGSVSLSSIKLTNRKDAVGERLNGATVELLNSQGQVVYRFSPISNAATNDVHTLTLPSSVTAQFIKVTHNNQFLHFTELQVFGWNSPSTTSEKSDDTFFGGTEVDRFVFASRDIGKDTVSGMASNDKLVFNRTAFADWQAVLAAKSQVGADTVITLSSTDSIRLAGFTSLTSSNIEFI